MSSIPELLTRLRTTGSVPAIATEAQRAEYAALAQKLHDGLREKGLNPAERAGSPEGRLASALWTRVAEWEEAGEEGE